MVGILLIFLLVTGNFSAVLGNDKQLVRKDYSDAKGSTPVFLQDPKDQMCLGPNGFTMCDENALWLLTPRSSKDDVSLVSMLHPGQQGMCLRRHEGIFGWFSNNAVTMGPCRKSGSKSWLVEIVNQKHLKLSTKGQCLVRGQKNLKNSVSTQSCSKGQYAPLVYHPTAVHEHGFYLKGADGSCFDGGKFVDCGNTLLTKVLFGIGIKYVSGEAMRYFYNFAKPDNCIVTKRGKVFMGSCEDSASHNWGLLNGQFSYSTNQCLGRKADDSAVLVNCKQGFEFIAIEVPTVLSENEISNAFQGISVS